VTRYGPRLYAVDYSDGAPSITADEVFVGDSGPQNTGLVDASGQAIWRYPDRAPIGFDLTIKPRVRVKAASRRTA
jgi:hypothetical protein